MSSHPQIRQISEHVSDINELRKTIAYCEGRILRKQIAIEELRLGLACGEEFPPGRIALNPPRTPVEQDILSALPAVKKEPSIPAVPAPPIIAPKIVDISVGEMVREILPEFAGKTFWYSDIKQRVLEKHPEHDQRIRRGVHSATTYLIQTGKIARAVGGLQIP